VFGFGIVSLPYLFYLSFKEKLKIKHFVVVFFLAIHSHFYLIPVILILEYNSLFGLERAITVPYSDSFQRTKAHYSNLYWGASLRALYNLSVKKGYEFIGCNSSGNNAYFILKEYMNNNLKPISLKEGYVMSKFRESRN